MFAFLFKIKWGENYVFDEMIKRLNAYSKEKNLGISWIPQGKIFGATYDTIQKVREIIKEDKRAQQIQ